MTYRSLFDIFDEPDTETEIQVRQNNSRFRMRPYQSDAVDNVFAEWEGGNLSTLVCLPTGTGKTVVFSEVMRRYSEMAS